MGRGQGTKTSATPAVRRQSADPFATVMGASRGTGLAQDPVDTDHKFVVAQDLKEGMLVDLSDDPYGDHEAAEFEYDTVLYLKAASNGPGGRRVLVHFEVTSVTFPVDHQLRVLISD